MIKTVIYWHDCYKEKPPDMKPVIVSDGKDVWKNCRYNPRIFTYQIYSDKAFCGAGDWILFRKNTRREPKWWTEDMPYPKDKEYK